MGREFNKGIYSVKGEYKTRAHASEVVNLEVVSKYLLTGSYAVPGSKHFLSGRYYETVDPIDIRRGEKSDLNALLDRIRCTVKDILRSHRRISLFITSGLDSYLLYLIFRLETK